MSQSIEILRAAAEYMSEHGHCKDRVEDDEGRVCLIGALQKGMKQLEVSWRDVDVDRALGSQIQIAEPNPLLPGYNMFDYIEWNNAPETTGEDVILALKNAASWLEDSSRKTVIGREPK